MRESTEPNAESPAARRGCAVLLGIWVVWASVMFVRTWNTSMQVDDAGPFTAAFLALLFGFVTFEGILLFHLPGILSFGGFAAIALVKEYFPDAPRIVVWIAGAVGAGLVVALFIWSIADSQGCDPLQNPGCR